MKDLMIFENAEFGQIRTVEIDGKPYFVANDIAKSLGYVRPADAISQHCRYTVKHRIPHPQSKTKTLEVNVIPEGDMYRLITHSELPSAERFESWVFDEVLPSLRKTGSYTIKETTDERLQIMKMNAQTRMAQTFLKLANVDTLSETYKNVLVSKSSEVLAGEQIIPLPAIEQRKTYSAGEIGNMFGVSSNKIGRIANQNDLKQPEYGEYRRDKSKYSSHECDTWVYFDSAVPVFAGILNQCK